MKSIGARWNNVFAVVVLLSVFSISFVPSVTRAVLAVQSTSPSLNALVGAGVDPAVAGAMVANKICAPFPFPPVIPCADPFSGTLGICVGTATCMALSTIAITGATIGIGLGIVGKLFKGDPDRPTGPIGVGYNAASPRCAGYYQVTTPTSDPCAIYVPPNSSSLLYNSAQLLNSLKSPSIGDALLVQANKVSAPAPAQNQAAPLPSGAKGGIQLTSTSATIQAGVRNVELNVESAGFFGSNVPQNTQPQGFIERICLVRPWQSPLISYGIPTSLFDNLCSSKSLRVGILPEIALPPAEPRVLPAGVQLAEPAQPAGPYVPPKVYIKASPISVSLGSRTTIRWDSQGVTSCTETSPDGSFNSNTLRGESSTVPITAATVFSISCIAPDGSHVTDSVTVNLAI